MQAQPSPRGQRHNLIDLDDLRTAVRAFVARYNTQWLIERHGHRTPREAYARAMQAVAAATSLAWCAPCGITNAHELRGRTRGGPPPT